MRFAVLVVLAGCSATVSDGDEGLIVSVDAPATAPVDAPIAIAIDASPDAPPPPPCVEGDTRMETASGCFAAFNALQTRADARASCAAVGMHLAFVRNAQDETVIASLAAGRDVAIGLDDLVTEGTFVWEDGSPLTYTDWHAGEPNDSGGIEDCAIYAGARVDGQWDDRPCTLVQQIYGVYAFICQR